MYGVTIAELIEKMKMKNMTPEIDVENAVVSHPDVNRPALQLAGFFDHFDKDRVQIVGFVEQEYIRQMEPERKKEVFARLLAEKIPCLIYSRGMVPDEDVLALCNHYDVPCMVSEQSTCDLMAEVIREAALELIKRGHRLVTDDVVQIRKVSDETLIGSAPDITKHFIELRGIGIIDVKSLYGVESIKETQSIDMVIKLEEWDRDKEYDRLGLEDQYTEFLGNQVVCHAIPVRPGRNLAIIVETAAINYRQKKMGYNAAKELYNRVQANLTRPRG